MKTGNDMSSAYAMFILIFDHIYNNADEIMTTAANPYYRQVSFYVTFFLHSFTLMQLKHHFPNLRDMAYTIRNNF